MCRGVCASLGETPKDLDCPRNGLSLPYEFAVEVRGKGPFDNTIVVCLHPNFPRVSLPPIWTLGIAGGRHGTEEQEHGLRDRSRLNWVEVHPGLSLSQWH